MEDSQPSSAHWCHECSAQTAAQCAVGGAHGGLVCADCGGGFIESMETARALIHVRRAVRRRERSQQRRLHNHSAALRRLEATILEADLSNPAFRQGVRRLVHSVDLLPSHSRSSGLRDATSNDVIDEAHGADDVPSSAAHSDHVVVSEGMSPYVRAVLNELDAPGQLGPSGAMRASGLEINEVFSHGITSAGADFGHVGIECVNPVELFNDTREQGELGENAESHDDEGEGRSMQLQYTTDEDDDASDEDVEVSVLELSDWDSIDEDDEDEWEEVEAGDTASLHRDDDVPDGVSVGHGSEGLRASSPSLEGNLQDVRIPRDILRRLHAIRRNLQGFNAEMDFENLNLDMYVGDPGDYVDARGFEELLQQFMDSDTTRRGPPPAAKSAIDGLPTVLVQRVDVENGSALCAICKDLIELNEPAKQLPCLHLYHGECILPWLSVRNSCPVCRHELPTDDPEYEEQRKYENVRQVAQQHEHSSSDSSSVSHEAGGQELGREGNPDGESNATDANVLFVDTSKGEVGDNTEARDCPTSNGHSRERGSLFNVIAGPLCSVVGLVVLSCLGNFVLGSSTQRHVVNNQAGRAREMRSSRSSWWASLFG